MRDTMGIEAVFRDPARETVARLQKTVGANLLNRPSNSKGGPFRDQDSAKDGQNPLLWVARYSRNPLWQNMLSPFLSVALLQSPWIPDLSSPIPAIL